MKKYYEAYNERYKILHKQNRQCFSTNTTPILKEVIKKYNITTKHKILELGCGEGRDSIVLLEKGYPLLATDISKEVIKYSQNRYIKHKDSFRQLNCLNDTLNDHYDFIFAVALLHMFVVQEDRNKFYQFIYDHLSHNAIALITSMGDGINEYESDITKAYTMIEKEYHGEKIAVPHTSCKIVNIETLKLELQEYFNIIDIGLTSIPDEFSHMIYVVIRKKG